MVDRDNPHEVIALAKSILDILASRGATQGRFVSEENLCDGLKADDTLVQELIDALDGYDPCPLVCEESRGRRKVYLRRTDTIASFIESLKTKPTNPLKL